MSKKYHLIIKPLLQGGGVLLFTGLLGYAAMSAPSIPAVSVPESENISSESSEIPNAKSGSRPETDIGTEKPDSSASAAETKTVPETDPAPENDPAQGFETASGNDPIQESDTTSGNDPVQESDITSGNDPVQESDIASEDDPVQESDMASEDDPVQESDMASEDDPVQESDMASEDETDTEKSFAAGTEANDEIPPFLFPSDFLKSDIFPEGFGRYTKVKVSDPVTWEDLESYLNNMISDYDGTWSIYIKDLAGDREISINDRSMEAASLIKLYIMGAVYDQLEKGNLEETQTISDSLYNMITVSDNESANILVRALSPDGDHSEGLKVVNRFIQQNGFQNTEQVNGLADPSLWTDDGRLNHTSARDCGMLLERIYKGNFVSHLASRDMETLLLGQEIDYKIPDSLPDGTISASKTGEVEGCENDTAIVYSPGGDYIICIMSNGWADDTAAVDRIHQLSETVYNYFNNADSKKFSIVAPEETNGLYEYTETETSDAVGVPVKIEDLANTDAQTEETDMGTE